MGEKDERVMLDKERIPLGEEALDFSIPSEEAQKNGSELAEKLDLLLRSEQNDRAGTQTRHGNGSGRDMAAIVNEPNKQIMGSYGLTETSSTRNWRELGTGLADVCGTLLSSPSFGVTSSGQRLQTAALKFLQAIQEEGNYVASSNAFFGADRSAMGEGYLEISGPSFFSKGETTSPTPSTALPLPSPAVEQKQRGNIVAGIPGLRRKRRRNMKQQIAPVAPYSQQAVLSDYSFESSNVFYEKNLLKVPWGGNGYHGYRVTTRASPCAVQSFQTPPFKLPSAPQAQAPLLSPPSPPTPPYTIAISEQMGVPSTDVCMEGTSDAGNVICSTQGGVWQIPNAAIGAESVDFIEDSERELSNGMEVSGLTAENALPCEQMEDHFAEILRPSYGNESRSWEVFDSAAVVNMSDFVPQGGSSFLRVAESAGGPASPLCVDRTWGSGLNDECFDPNLCIRRSFGRKGAR